MAPQAFGGKRNLIAVSETADFVVGVVDSSLLVYGTTNLRIVDASIFPLHVAAHTQSTVYAIAEKVCRNNKFNSFNLLTSHCVRPPI